MNHCLGSEQGCIGRRNVGHALCHQGGSILRMPEQVRPPRTGTDLSLRTQDVDVSDLLVLRVDDGVAIDWRL
jgi:hypothetical protein